MKTKVLLSLFVGFFCSFIASMSHGFACSDLTDMEEGQCDILSGMYHSMDGANRDSSTDGDTTNNWLTGTLACDVWEGVECNASGFVTNLLLQQQDLSGALPANLSGLTAITFFNVGLNNITGPLPASLGSRQNIAFFNIGTNNITGTLPAERSGRGASLNYFHADMNNLYGNLPASYSAWTSLLSMTLHNNNFTGSLPSSRSAFGSLDRLELHNNQLQGELPTSRSGMSNLSYFYVSNNNLYGTLPVSRNTMTSMTEFFITGNAFIGTIPSSWISNRSSISLMHIQNNCLTINHPAGAQTRLTTYSGTTNPAIQRSCVDINFTYSGTTQVQPGSGITIQFNYFNSGTSTATGIILTGHFPTSIDAPAPSPSNQVSGFGWYKWINLGNIAPRSGGTVTLTRTGDLDYGTGDFVSTGVISYTGTSFFNYTGNDTGQFNFTISDTLAPTAARVSLSGGLSTGNNPFKIERIVNDNVDLFYVQVQLGTGNGTLEHIIYTGGVAFAGPQGSGWIEFTNYPNNHYYYRLVMEDRAGNFGTSAIYDFIYDKSLPLLVLNNTNTNGGGGGGGGGGVNLNWRLIPLSKANRSGVNMQLQPILTKRREKKIELVSEAQGIQRVQVVTKNFKTLLEKAKLRTSFRLLIQDVVKILEQLVVEG